MSGPDKEKPGDDTVPYTSEAELEDLRRETVKGAGKSYIGKRRGTRMLDHVLVDSTPPSTSELLALTIPAPPPDAWGQRDGELVDRRYRLEEQIGQGAMGIVYLGQDVMLDRPVAVKRINRTYSQRKEFVARFIEEARSLARIRHEHVVQIYTFGQHLDDYFLAMEYVPGETLDEIIDKHCEYNMLLSPHNALPILQKLTAGVAAIHAQGMVHCDLKPSNVVIENDTGRPVIIDFGVARESDSKKGALSAATPGYMAPERAASRGAITTEAADIYALGCMTYEVLTGVLPFEHDQIATLMKMHAEAPRPLISDWVPELATFDAVVVKALQPDPKQRYRSCHEFARDILEASREFDLPVGAMPTLPPEERTTLRVMVVDDDPVFSQVATGAAEIAFLNRRVQVSQVRSGAEAIEEATEQMPDLIVLDFHMPQLDGVATLSIIRELPGGRNTRVIVVSGALDRVRWRFAALGVQSFLSKPVRVSQLVDMVKTLAERSGWLHGSNG